MTPNSSIATLGRYEILAELGQGRRHVADQLLHGRALEIDLVTPLLDLVVRQIDRPREQGAIVVHVLVVLVDGRQQAGPGLGAGRIGLAGDPQPLELARQHRIQRAWSHHPQ